MRTTHIKFFAVTPAATLVARGFTLIELAIVLFVVALLLGGMLLPLAGQQDIRNYGDTQKILTEARDALVGFAMANGRLPCPAAPDATGVEDPVGGGPCNHPYDGFFPAATLGFAPVDANGYLLDGWGGERIHRIRYAVSKANSSAFTTLSGMQNTKMEYLTPDLQICNTGTPPDTLNMATPDTATCAAGKSLATDAVAVIYSLGKNAGTGGTTDEEKHNPNRLVAGDPAFVAADRAFVNAVQGAAFDDQLLWLSKSTLFNRMVAAGRLP